MGRAGSRRVAAARAGPPRLAPVRPGRASGVCSARAQTITTIDDHERELLPGLHALEIDPEGEMEATSAA